MRPRPRSHLLGPAAALLLLGTLTTPAHAATPRVAVAPIGTATASAGSVADLAQPVRDGLVAHLEAYEGATVVTEAPDLIVQSTLRTKGDRVELDVRLVHAGDRRTLHRFWVDDDHRDAPTLAAGAAAGLSAYWLDHPFVAATPAPRERVAVAQAPKVPKVAQIPRVTRVAPPLTPEAESAAVDVETSNALAGWLFWGGVVVAAAGAGLGVTGKLAYDQPLQDGTTRSAQDNQDLLDGGRRFALAGDAALITGGVSALCGLVFWIVGVGESPVLAHEEVQP